MRIRGLRVLLATSVAVLIAAPAACAGVTVHITRTTDAPAGVTPKLTFRIGGLVRHAQYFMRWDTPGAYDPSCTQFGSSITSKVPVHTLKWTLPDGSYDAGYYKPFCENRTYRGRVVRKLSGGGSQIVKTFHFKSTGALV